jgi:hypothetical protein
LGSFVEDQLATDAWVYIWIFYSDGIEGKIHQEELSNFNIYATKLGQPST